MGNRPEAADPLVWEELSTEHLVQDEWIDFRKSTYRLPDGAIFSPFYTYTRRNYVVIVATDPDGNYICVRQFRQGIRQVTVEFPAGGIEQSDPAEDEATSQADASDQRNDAVAAASQGYVIDSSEIQALAAAKRELLEETGYESDAWEHLLTVPSDATVCDNYAHLFAARNCRRVSGQNLDETEFLNVELHSEDEIEDLIAKGGFQQCVHITAWLLARRQKG